jgi:hypothetical protein
VSTTIYNSYLTGNERTEAIEEAEIENQFSKLNLMLEMVNMRLEQNIKDAELKVFRESGTYDDLQYLCEEAENQAAEQKQNIFQKIIGVILRIFNSIGEGIKKLFNIQGNPEDEIEIDKNIVENHNAIVNGWDNVKSGISSIASGNFANGIKQLFDGIKWPTFVAVGGATAVVATQKIKRLDANKMIENVKRVRDEAQARFKEISDKFLNWLKPENHQKKDSDEGESNGFMTDFKNKFLNPINKWVSNMGTVLGEKVDNAKKKLKIKGKKQQDDNNNGNADNNTNNNNNGNADNNTNNNNNGNADNNTNNNNNGNAYNNTNNNNNGNADNNTNNNNNGNADNNTNNNNNGNADNNTNNNNNGNADNNTNNNNNGNADNEKSAMEAQMKAIAQRIKSSSGKKQKNLKKQLDSLQKEYQKTYGTTFNVNESMGSDIIFGTDMSAFIESYNNKDEDYELSVLADMFNSL